MILALILGAIIGFATQIPVGPINAAVVMHGVRERFSRGMALGVGAAFMDMVYCAAAMFGISVISDNPALSILLEVAAFIMLLVLGVKSFRTKTTLDDLENEEMKAEERLAKKVTVQGPFFLGVLLYLANPTFLPYWLGVSGLLQRYGLLVPTSLNNTLFSVGVGVGSALWFYLILVFLLRRKVSLSPGVLNGVYKFSGLTLLAFGSYLGYRLVALTDWLPLLRMLSLAR